MLASKRDGKGESVLICGVDAVFGLLLERILHRAGVSEIYHTHTGEEALAFADRSHPGIILTEMRLPGMDGIELADRLRGANSTSTFVMYDQPGDCPRNCAGAAGCIEKPVSERDLVALLERRLHGGAAT